MDSGVQPKRIGNEHLLETANLLLRTPQLSDIDDYVTLLSDVEVMKYIGVEQGKLPTRDEVITLVDLATEVWENRGYGRWSIFEQSTGKFVGFTGFRCEEGVPELVSVVHECFWGKRYAFEASRAAIDYGFANLGFTKLTAVSRPANQRARAMIERLGFEFKGIIDFHGVEGASYVLSKS